MLKLLYKCYVKYKKYILHNYYTFKRIPPIKSNRIFKLNINLLWLSILKINLFHVD